MNFPKLRKLKLQMFGSLLYQLAEWDPFNILTKEQKEELMEIAEKAMNGEATC